MIADFCMTGIESTTMTLLRHWIWRTMVRRNRIPSIVLRRLMRIYHQIRSMSWWNVRICSLPTYRSRSWHRLSLSSEVGGSAWRYMYVFTIEFRSFSIFCRSQSLFALPLLSFFSLLVSLYVTIPLDVAVLWIFTSSLNIGDDATSWISRVSESELQIKIRTFSSKGSRPVAVRATDAISWKSQTCEDDQLPWWKVAYFIWSHSCLFNHDCQLSSLDSPPENFIGKRGHFASPWKIIASSILSKQHISIMLSFAKGGNIGSYIELQSDRMHRNLCQNTIEYDNMLIIKMMFWKETTLWMTITTLRWYSASGRGRRAPLVTFVGVRHCTLLSYTSL